MFFGMSMTSALRCVVHNEQRGGSLFTQGPIQDELAFASSAPSKWTSVQGTLQRGFSAIIWDRWHSMSNWARCVVSCWHVWKKNHNALPCKFLLSVFDDCEFSSIWHASFNDGKPHLFSQTDKPENSALCSCEVLQKVQLCVMMSPTFQRTEQSPKPKCQLTMLHHESLAVRPCADSALWVFMTQHMHKLDSVLVNKWLIADMVWVSSNLNLFHNWQNQWFVGIFMKFSNVICMDCFKHNLIPLIQCDSTKFRMMLHNRDKHTWFSQNSSNKFLWNNLSVVRQNNFSKSLTRREKETQDVAQSPMDANQQFAWWCRWVSMLRKHSVIRPVTDDSLQIFTTNAVKTRLCDCTGSSTPLFQSASYDF